MKMIQKRLFLFFVLAIALVGGPIVAAQGDENGIESLRKTSKAFSEIARKATPAVVFIEVEKTIETQAPQLDFPQFRSPFGNDPFEEFFSNPRSPQTPRKYRQGGQGSGFIISADGYILSNHHVVGDADKITVKLRDGREFQAKKIGTDEKSDIAVIKIEAGDLPTVVLGDSDKMEIGEWVIAIGNPFGLAETVTVGIVSAKGRSTVGINDYEDFIQTDAAINPGNSGGPLLNLDGEVIGINTAIFSRSGGYMGIGFAIPANMAKSIKDQLIQGGKVRRGQLGVIIQEVTPELAESMNLKISKGVLISDVVKGSAADKAGLKTGDVILEMNGKAVEGVGPLRNEIAMTSPDTQIEMLIDREGKRLNKKVQIGELGEEQVAAADQTPADVTARLGLTIDNIKESYRQYFDEMPDKGVIVTQVESGSEAERKGVNPGAVILSVNRKEVNSVAEFNKAVAEAASAKKVLLLVKEKKYTRFVPLTLE